MSRTTRIAPILILAACGSEGGTSESDSVPPGWQPVVPTTLPSSCGTELEPVVPARASSLRRGYCDFGETADSVQYDLLCPPDTPCEPGPTGDQLCHRVCGDGACAEGEICQERVIYVSDTPSRSANLCMCAAGDCMENPETVSTDEGGLSAWRDETPMLVDLYYHAMAATDAQLFVSGGLKVMERLPNGATLEQMATIHSADLDADGAVSGWREVGALAAPTVHHAMAVVNGRLYVAGGQVLTASGPAEFTDAVVSYPIMSDGSLGAAREEVSLPQARGWHELLVDPGDGQRPPRLIVASGALDSRYFSDGTSEIAFAEIEPSDGALGAWSSIEAPAPLYFEGVAAVAAGTLYTFVAGEYLDRSSRALYGIRLTDLTEGALPSSFTRNEAWPWDPAALSAVNEHVHLIGACGMLVLLAETGAAATAPVDAAEHVGEFRAAARFFGPAGGGAVALSPSGRIYESGAVGSEADGKSVRSAAVQ